MASVSSLLNIDIRARDRASGTLRTLESSIIRVVGAVASAAAAIGTIAFPITQAAEYERALADVSKTTGFTKAQIDQLSTSVLEMSTRMSVSAQELANIAAIGGQLGLGTGGVAGIEAFTESVGRATVTLGLVQDKAAEAAAQMINIFKIPEADVERIFSTFNELSNNSVATVDALVDITRRLGDLAGGFENAAALSAYARELGISAEVAGTAYATFFTRMASDADKFAAAVGVSQQEWITLLENNGVEALKLVAKELNNLDSVAKADGIKTLFGSGRQGALATKIVADAANDFSNLNKLVRLANNGFTDGTSSIKEYENVMDTLTEQTKLLFNQLRSVAITVGQDFVPLLRGYVESLQQLVSSDDFLEQMRQIGENFRRVIESIANGIQYISSLNIDWAQVFKIAGFLLAGNVAIGLLKRLGLAVLFLARPLTTIATKLSSFSKILFDFSVSATTAARAMGGAGLVGALLKGVRLFSVPGLVFTAATVALSAYGDDILSTLGFVTEEEDRLLKERTENYRKHLKDLRAIYTEALKYEDRLNTISEEGIGSYTKPIYEVDNTNELLTQTRLTGEIGKKAGEDAAEGVNRAIAAYNSYTNVLKGTRTELALLAEKYNGLANISDGLDFVNKLYEGTAQQAQEADSRIQAIDITMARLVEREQEINDTIQQRADAGSLYQKGAGVSEANELADLEREMNELQVERARVVVERERLEANINNLYQQRVNLTAADAAAQAQADLTRQNVFANLTSESADAVLALRDLTEATLAVQDVREKLAELENAPQDERTAEQIYDIRRLKGELSTMLPIQADLVRAYDESKQAVQGYGDVILEQVEQLDVDTLRGLADDVETIGDNFEAQAVSMNGAANSAYEVALRIEDVKLEIEDAKGEFYKFQKIGESIVGTMDNMYRSFTAGVNKYQDLVNAAERRNRVERDTLKLTQAGIIDDVKEEAALDKITDKYEKLRQKIIERTVDDSPQQKYQLTQLKIREELEKNQVTRQREARDAARELAAIYNQQNEERRRFAGLEERAVELRTKLGNAGEDPEKIARLQLEYADLVKDIQDYRDSAGEAATEAGRLQEVIGQAPGTSFVGTGIVDPDAIERQLLQGFEQANNNALDLQVNIKPDISRVNDVGADIFDNTPKLDELNGKLTALTARLKEYETLTSTSFIQATQAAAGAIATNRELLESYIASFDKLNSLADSGQPLPNTYEAEVEGQLRSLGDVLGGVLTENGRKYALAALSAMEENNYDNVGAYVAASTEEAMQAVTDRIAEQAATASAQAATDAVTIIENSMGRVGETMSQELKSALSASAEALESESLQMHGDLTIDSIDLNGIAEAQLRNLSSSSPQPRSLERRARGGYISGPGTGTSDSIPALLSNGEYVMDAYTTRLFGSGFFKNLQTLARSGRPGSLKIPRFATGGPVGVPVPALPNFGAVLDSISKGNGSAQNVTDVVELIVRDAIGDEIGRLEGSRDSVQALTDALKTLRRR